IISVVIYILIGLFVYPVFALGGGPKYLLDFNFGYILAYIPAVFFASSILKNGFCFKNILQAALVAVLTIHILGILYTMLIGLISHTTNTIMLGWILAQSGTKILYDFMFSVISIIIAGAVKRFLWITMC
ncbi:MAG: biotin transporter BioY, partial [Candidatus Gastranaerophilaceae bacterium]